jgi:hypothetical protein
VVANNTVVASACPVGSPASAVIETDLPMPAGGWLLARCWGAYNNDAEQWTAAITSPVYVERDGRTPAADPAVVAKFVGDLDKMSAWVQQEARCENSQQRERLAAVFQAARNRLELLQKG